MKIAYIVQHFSSPHEPGGARPFQTCKLLSSLGHEVHVITAQTRVLEGTTKGWTRAEIAGFTVHTTPVAYSNAMGWRERVKAFIVFATRATTKARGLRADVVFASSTPLTVAIPGIAASAGRCAFVFEVRDLWPEMPIAFGALENSFLRRLAFALARLAYRRAQHIVALSEGMKSGVVQHDISPEKVSVIPNGCDFRDENTGENFGGFRARGLEGRKKIVFVGSMGSLYDLNWAVTLGAYLHEMDDSVAVCLIGTGGDRTRVVKFADQCKALDRSVYFFEPIPREHVFSALSQATVVLSVAADVPGIEDNSANKFFDGLAVERPVAINYGGWQGELLERYRAGLSLPRDCQLAAERLITILRDRDELMSMGRAAGQLGAAKFNRRELVRELEVVLEEARTTYRDRSRPGKWRRRCMGAWRKRI